MDKKTSGSIPVPGEEASSAKETKALYDLMGFLKNDSIEDFSRIKGHSYIYKMYDFSTT